MKFLLTGILFICSLCCSGQDIGKYKSILENRIKIVKLELKAAEAKVKFDKTNYIAIGEVSSKKVELKSYEEKLKKLKDVEKQQKDLNKLAEQYNKAKTKYEHSIHELEHIISFE